MSPGAASFWASLPLGPGVTVLKHDRNGVGALSKPAGVLSHPNAAGDRPRSLLSCRFLADEECFDWTPGPVGSPPRRLWLLNRLDSGTSGVILVAGDGGLAEAVRALFQRRAVAKTYAALVFGRPAAPVQVWRDRLAVDKRGGVVRTARGGGQESESRMSVVQRGGPGTGVTLVRLEPRTGRSHQLRVQCAGRGLPIVGDRTYGDFARNREFAKRTGNDRLFLHSLELGFEYEFRGRKNAFQAVAPAPREFVDFL